ncbi:unnamed protein product [Cuscuta campestris]|uniref:Uncharacterized protein n=1 Tax=Cuscuta campestris TaxID=132261 RepID=A0A484LLX7_9ASTE|nr:unnamed protein product [Cuscuta campestris]
MSRQLFQLISSLNGLMIRACLLAVLSLSVHKHARGFTTSAALWDALAARYNSVSTAHVYQLRDKLHTLRKGTKTMTQYLDDVATILSDLDALKEEIPEPLNGSDCLFQPLNGSDV